MVRVQYATTFFHSKSLREVAEGYLKYLPDNIEGLLSTGSSGCAIASAMMACSDRELIHVYIRKHGESAHGSDYAGSLRNDIKYAIVDDFIDSGKTMKSMKKWAKERKLNVTSVIVHRYLKHTGRRAKMLILIEDKEATTNGS